MTTKEDKNEMGSLVGFFGCLGMILLSAAFWGAIVYGCCRWAAGG